MITVADFISHDDQILSVMTIKLRNTVLFMHNNLKQLIPHIVSYAGNTHTQSCIQARAHRCAHIHTQALTVSHARG